MLASLSVNSPIVDQKEKPVVASRINRAIELLAQDQAIYYVGAHSGHVLTRAQGREDAGTWADYINIGMEHGAFDMAGLEEYLRGMVEAGPTRSGHRTPTIIVEALGLGTRGRGSESSAAPIWGVSEPEYRELCDPWPLSQRGELLLGVKLESPEGIARCEEILSVPGIGFAELGPGDLSLALRYREMPRDPYPPEMQEARDKVFAACRQHGVAFLETGAPETIAQKLDEGVRVIAGHREETARIGRAHEKRTLPA